MKSLKCFLIFGALCLSAACNHTSPVITLDPPNSSSQQDEQYANAFKMLDGTWKGIFTIYEDSNPEKRGSIELEKLSKDLLDKRALKIVDEIEVVQKYTSESPYFQKVDIIDYYPKTKKSVKSYGVNKVENGQMWCVVKKPTETIIHQGKLEDKRTIIWSSSEESPLKVEYFYETVNEAMYEIIGYGYYSGDDITLNPKLWFYAAYEKQ